MAKEKVLKGTPGAYIVDLSHKTLGKFDEKGEFRTDDPDTIKRIELMEEHEAALKKKPLGERLAEQHKQSKYEQYKEIANVMVDVMIDRGLVTQSKEKK